MKRLVSITAIALLGALWALPAAAQAEYGFTKFDATFTNADGSPDTQAGSHPFEATTSFILNSHGPTFESAPDGEVKNLLVDQVPGLVGDATAMPRCSTLDFLTDTNSDLLNGGNQSEKPACPDNTAVGVAGINIWGTPPFAWSPGAIFNLVPPPGTAARLGFVILDQRIVIDVGVREGGAYNLVARSSDAPQPVVIFGAKLALWGNPSDPAHDSLRGSCYRAEHLGGGLLAGEVNFAEAATGGSCPYSGAKVPFLTLPRACQGPLSTSYASDSWQNPGALLPDGEPNLADPAWVRGSVLTHDGAEPSELQGFTGCGKLPFKPSITAEPTTKAAGSPTGLDFSLNVQDEGLKNPEGLANSDIRKVEVTLPEGMSANPALAEGLNVCTEADLQRETLDSEPGQGCPDESKIGTVEVDSQLLEEGVNGALYVAKPYENPFGSLLALYVVIKNPKLGIIVKQPLDVERNPQTGQLTTVAENLPQLPFSHFKLHFREGARSPLSSPPSCGTFEATAVMYPWSGSAPFTTTGAFQIISGADNGACPSGATPPFRPGLIAGSLNNAAGAYSPFNVRLSRTDGEQEITHFSIKLPPGITGKLAGIPFCSDQAIAAAKAREGKPHGGQEEIEHPSCPATSEVGHTLVGAGVGPSLTYVPGKAYLAGPYNGSPLSIVAITAAKAGPFDLGTVVVREALRINPETAEVFVDATGSDPIPHIIQGVPVRLRDIRVYVDRPDFVLNPTSCGQTSTASTLLGSGTNFASEADDQPVTVSTRYQAASCASLPYKPAIQLQLKGKTKRGGNPALTAILTPRPGDANSKKVSVALPHSEFLDQAHIKTICTRVQFKEGAGNGEKCPAASIYGHARAWTPLLSEPLEGPVFLRSSEHPLPDLVLALHGLVDFTAVGRIDSVNGGIRNSFEAIPDAPISKVEVSFPGGKKSLLENSTNICLGKHNAQVEFGAQSGKEAEAKVPLKPNCKGKARKHHKHHKKKAAKKNRGR